MGMNQVNAFTPNELQTRRHPFPIKRTPQRNHMSRQAKMGALFQQPTRPEKTHDGPKTLGINERSKATDHRFRTACTPRTGDVKYCPAVRKRWSVALLRPLIPSVFGPSCVF